MRDEGEYGTNADRTKNIQYCKECYQYGKFTEDITIEKMIERVAVRMHEEMDLNEVNAAKMAVSMIPKLARWQ